MTPDEKKETQRLHLIEKLSISTIAKKVDRDRGSIRHLLQSDESKALRSQLDGDAREQVLQLLKQGGVSVARQWERAVARAADKGDHRAGRDWLLHAGLIDPVPDDANWGTRIAIVIGTDERPMRVPSPLALARGEADEGEDEGHHGPK